MKRNHRKLLTGLILGLLLLACFSATVSAASVKSKIVTKNGKQYYYNSAGKLVKGKYGFKIGKQYYRISKTGVLTKVSKAEGMAGELLNPYYGKYSKKQILWKAFQWSASLKYFTNPTKVPASQTKEAFYGLYGFQYKKGDCNVQAATFYWMAKVLGYNVKMVQGYVPKAKNASGKITVYGAHAWTTIKTGVKTYVYDPNFSGYCTRYNMLKKMKSGYGFAYGTKNTYRYFSSKKKELK